MKAGKTQHGWHTTLPQALLLIALIAVSSCMKEDDELQRQVAGLNEQLKARTAELDAKTKALEQAQGAGQPAAPPVSGEELTKARAQISELQQQLAAARQQAPADGSSPPKKSGNLDLDEMKQKLERDLSEKAARLRDLVLQQTGVAKINATTTESIQFPPEVIAPFHSAISFTLPAANGQQCIISFPVEADFSGTWSLPTPAEIQNTYKMVREKFSERFAGTPGGTPPPTSGGNVASNNSSQPRPPAPQADDWKNMEFVETAPGVITMRPRRPQSVPDPKELSNTPRSNPPPSGQTGSTSPPSKNTQSSPPPQPPQPFNFNGPNSGVVNSQPPPSQPPASSPPAVPAPVMPVQRDVIIRWK